MSIMATITKDMTIAELVGKYPQSIPVLQDAGMGCIGCALASSESLGAGAQAHGIEDIDALIQKLNKAIQGDE